MLGLRRNSVLCRRGFQPSLKHTLKPSFLVKLNGKIKLFSQKAKHRDMKDIMIHKYLEVKTGYRSSKVLPFIKIPSSQDCCPPSWICHIARAVNWKDNLGTTIFVVLETKWLIDSMILISGLVPRYKMAEEKGLMWSWL